jgi:hypothetical protein
MLFRAASPSHAMNCKWRAAVRRPAPVALDYAVRFSPRLAGVLLMAIALLRVASTFRTFSATTDEAWHVGSGLEVIQYHRYLLQKANPRLPQVVMAVAPYLGGIRVLESGNLYQQIYPVFYNEQSTNGTSFSPGSAICSSSSSLCWPPGHGRGGSSGSAQGSLRS